MAAAVEVSSSHGTGPVIFLTHQHGPSGARGLVGNGNRDEPGRFAPQEGPHLGTGSGVVGFGPTGHGGGADDQQASQITVAHLRDVPEAVLATRRVLSGHKAEEGRKLSS